MPSPFELAPPQEKVVRRLSSANADNMDHLQPTVIVPPKHLSTPSNAHETAASIELAKFHLDENGSSTGSTPRTPPLCKVTDDYAFAFDIDGVLIRGGYVIPEAIEAMKVLNGENSYGIKVPYIFLTNGGGKTEEERCTQLSKQLDMEVSPGQFICGHTPMAEMTEKYKTVLVIGGEGEKCRHVAEGYGFENVITPGDLIKTNPDMTPFRKLSPEELAVSKSLDLEKLEIEAIFVFADSRDWAADSQIILDILMSKHGKVGTRSESFQEGPPIFFAHNDIVWATSYDYTRLGMGALRTCIETMYKAVTGKVLTTTAFGKPQIGTFQFATRLLRRWRKETHGINKPIQTVYFVGDTPESDIRGTNEYNESGLAHNEWYSILVKTGVYEDGTEPAFKPKAIVENVLDAVKHGMARERTKCIRAMITEAASDLSNGVDLLREHAEATVNDGHSAITA